MPADCSSKASSPGYGAAFGLSFGGQAKLSGAMPQTWDYSEAKALVEKHGIKRWAHSIELYTAAPGYKALAKSTTSDFVANV
jgi:hypothetical protein